MPKRLTKQELYTMMEYRYVYNLSFFDIAVLMNRSQGFVHRNLAKYAKYDFGERPSIMDMMAANTLRCMKNINIKNI